MEAIIWIVVIVTVIITALAFWPVTIGIGIVWLAIYIIRKEMKANKMQREEEERLQRKHNHEQAQHREALLNFCDASLSLFEAMPRHLMTTEELLDQADVDFQERAFAPFWDSVQQAATQLGRYDESVRKITENAELHQTVTQKFEGKAPLFPISSRSVDGIQAAKPSNERLSSFVRKAQRDFEFATIFEQRKTNQLLIAGFTNLAQALDGMGQRIASSIDDLSDQVLSISSSIDSMGNVMTEKLEGIQTTIIAHSESMATRHDRALEMLDNIQRRRRPRPAGLRDGEY